MTEEEERQSVVVEGRSWVRTPYHNYANVKGAGVDCAHFLVEAFVGAGLVERFPVEKYSHDWHRHHNEEKYLAKIEEYLGLIDGSGVSLIERPEFHALPGDVLVWQIGRTFSHGAIVTKWPYIVHASFPARIVLEESVLGSYVERRPVRVYSYWGRTK